jgi:hypothetical protein
MVTAVTSRYTPLLIHMLSTVPVWCRRIASALGLFVLIIPGFAQQASAPANAEQFVSEMLSKAGTPATVSLVFENRSSLSAEEFKKIKHSIEAEVRRRNLKLVAPEVAIAECKVTISENARSLLWIGEVKQGLNNSYAMLAVPRSAVALPKKQVLSIRDSMLWSQPEPILDFAQTDASHLTVLGTDSVIYMVREVSGWRTEKRQTFRYGRVMPHDARGKLVLGAASVEAFLPGAHCAGSTNDQQLTCAQVDDPWPLDPSGTLRAFFAPNANFFTGAIGGRREPVPPFFSATRTFNGGEPVWIATGIDGVARLYSDWSKPLATFSDWGSDIASVAASCGREQVIVSRPGDATENDAVQAVEISEGDAQPTTVPVQFAGPLMSMSSAGESARAVVYNRSTHNYEAHVLTVVCE